LLGYARVGIGALRRSGVLRSLLSGRPVDASGAPIPWWTYAAIRAVDAELEEGDRVVEFGAGHSTLWFASRVARVTAVETDERWVEAVGRTLPDGSPEKVKILHSAEFDRPLFEGPLREASVVVIDGAWRDRVAGLVAEVARSARLVVLDNTDMEERADLPEIVRRGLGGHACRLRSMGPCLLWEWETTLLFTDRYHAARDR
jgi:precorrin-6B methylase 2